MAEHQELAPLERRPLERGNNHHLANSIVDLEAEGSDNYSHIRAYWHILLKRRWTVLTVAFMVAILVAIISFKMQPVYQATARVEVEAETQQIRSLNDLYQNMPTDEIFLQTQVNVLKSENLAWKTIQQLGLGTNPDFDPLVKTGGGSSAVSQMSAQNRLIQAFRGRLNVQVMRDSRMVEVSFESGNPQLAARVANALVNNFSEYNFHEKYDATRQASGWMEQQLDELKAKVEKSQQAMVDYERQNAIIDVGDKQSVVEQKLGDVSKDLTIAQSDRMQKESLYDMVKTNESQVALLAQDALLQQLEGKEADLKSEYVDALGQYGPNYPKVTRLRSQLNEIQSISDGERKRIVARIHNDYLAALGREKLMAAAVVQEKAEVGKLSQLLIQHNMLKREFETNEQLYESLLQHLKDATVSAGLRATNIHLIDPALTPSLPVRPRKMFNIAVGLMVGLMLGVTIAFVQESVDTSIKGAEDLERLIAAPALAVIPKMPSAWLRSRQDRIQTENEAPELVVLNQPTSSLAESFRTLRTSVLLSTAPRPPKALLVTSAQPGEGKTCTSLNLAVGLAQRGVRVLIVDADLRRPGVSRGLGLSENGAGLSSLLSGAHSMDEVLRPYEPVPDLWVLSAGPRPPNPADLLSSLTMENVLHELCQRFDHVVLDSAPMLMVTDATILSTLVDGVLLVVESGVTPRGAVVRAHRILESAGGRILGTVLNKLDLTHDGYYGSYYRRYYHSYYHGYGGKPLPADAQATVERSRDGLIKS